MSSVSIQGNASGTGIFTIASPNSNTNRTLTLPDATGTIITTAGGAAISGTTGAFTTTVGVGGATPAASGAGITFPATASASSDANTLDDYEEGTWTPVDGSAAGLTLTVSNSKYTKIGQMVYVCAEITYPSNSDGNRVSIGGLPFTCSASSAWGGSVRYTNSSQTIPTLAVQPTTTRIEAYQNSGSSFTNSQISQDRFDFFAFYSV